MTRLGQVLPLGLVLGLVIAIASPVHAVDPPAAVKKLFDQTLDAVKTGDRDAFIANATEAVKKGVTDEVMASLMKDLGARLKKGFDPTYLCELKQAGHEVYLWKVTFKDGGDDMIIRLALKDGKMGGFFLQ